MKKRYTMNLNQESMEVVQVWLASKGLSFSGWMAGIIDEFAKEIQGEPAAMSKEPGEMTLQEFMDVMQYWLKKHAEV